MHDYKKLKVWQETIGLVTIIYAITKSFPVDERFNLISQINRSVVSIAANIAEGAGRNTKGEFKNFLGVAIGSSYELETQLIISNKSNFICDNKLDIVLERLNGIQRMLSKLKQSLKD